MVRVGGYGMAVRRAIMAAVWAEVVALRVSWLVLVVLLVGCGKETIPAAVTDGCWLDATPCRHGEGGDLWTVQMEPDEDLGDEFQVLTVAPPESFAGDSLLSVWKGSDMYMGELPVPLVKNAHGQWQATFPAAPSTRT